MIQRVMSGLSQQGREVMLTIGVVLAWLGVVVFVLLAMGGAAVAAVAGSCADRANFAYIVSGYRDAGVPEDKYVQALRSFAERHPDAVVPGQLEQMEAVVRYVWTSDLDREQVMRQVFRNCSIQESKKQGT